MSVACRTVSGAGVRILERLQHGCHRCATSLRTSQGTDHHNADSPGAVIQIDELMTDLRLGRTPIREALKLLEAQKLVVVSPRRGMFVADVTLTDLLQIHEIRYELRLAMCGPGRGTQSGRPTRGDAPAGPRMWTTTPGKCDQATLLQLDRRFHALIGRQPTTGCWRQRPQSCTISPCASGISA